MREQVRAAAIKLRPIAVVVLGVVALAVVALGLHGWMRWLGVPVVLALVVLPARQARAMRRSSLRACEEVVNANALRIRELSEWQGTLAHELNNPLTTIKGLAWLMARDPDKSHERLDKLQSAVGNLQRVIEGMLSFERSSSALVVTRVELRALAEEVAATYRPLAEQRHVELVVEPGHPVALDGDRDKLKQTLMSLVHNAIDASPDGEQIALALTSDGERARVSVLDRGPGVPAHELARIVEPGVTTKPERTGLGLTAARALIQQHGGTLVVENRAHGGFAAHVELPLSPSRF